MGEHRYILEPYSGMKSRYHCPGCNNREKTFSRYIDTQTGQYVADHVGRCNRESKCGYHYTPKQYFSDNGLTVKSPLLSLHGKATPQMKYSKGFDAVCCSLLYAKDNATSNELPEPSFIDPEIFKGSLSEYENNNFTAFLVGLFGPEITSGLIKRYFIGTSKHLFKRKDYPGYISPKGSTVFYQIDNRGRIRAGKIMLYNPETGHRVKEPFNHITWTHKALKIEPYNLKQCLFGEHILKGNTLPVAIVESEKTACIASIYLPSFVWLACGQLQGLSLEKCKVLAGRRTVLFPDLRGFDTWNKKATELRGAGLNVTVSDLLERKASEADREQGYDLADYLVKFDVSDFRQDVPHVPHWYVDMQGILRQYQAGEITGNQFLDLQDENWKQSGLSMNEYVKQANELSGSK